MATMDLKIPWSKNLAYDIRSGQGMHFLEITTTFWIENILYGDSPPNHLVYFLEKNQNAPRPSEHPPVRGKKCQNV